MIPLLIALLLPAQVPVTVVSVHDGDTLTVSLDGGLRQPVRLAGIDAPELAQPGPWGVYARDRLRALVAHGQVTVRVEPGRDPYGRLLATVLVDGRPVQEDLVAWGLAYAWVPAGGKRPSTWARLQAAEAWARESGAGVWSDPALERPDQWRKRKRAG
jgi:micrococcal nuclease